MRGVMFLPFQTAAEFPYFNPRTPRGVRRGAFDILQNVRQNFNPRTPRGVRRCLGDDQQHGPARFQSTHPSRGATMDTQVIRLVVSISIHAPLAGCDIS